MSNRKFSLACAEVEIKLKIRGAKGKDYEANIAWINKKNAANLRLTAIFYESTSDGT